MAHGYDPNLFLDPVRQDYLCGICYWVLNNPRLCEAKEHYFCLSCITQYLAEVSQTCPECQKPLTLDTLKRPQYFLPMILSELRIKCDYNSRGCPEIAQLGMLQDHLSVCEYRPVMCESCGQQVNANDDDNHKNSFCPANMRVIEGFKKSQEEMMNEIKTISATQKKIIEKQNKLEETQNKRGQKLEGIDFLQNSQKEDMMKANNGHKENNTFTNLYRCEIGNQMRGIDSTQDDVPMEVQKMKKLQRNDLNVVTNGYRESHTFTNADIRRTRNDKRGINERQQDVSKDVKKVKKSPQRIDVMEAVNGYGESPVFTNSHRCEMKNEMRGINERQVELHMKVEKMKENLGKMKETQSGLNEKVNKTEEDVVVIKQNYEKVEGLLNRLLHERHATSAVDISLPEGGSVEKVEPG